MDPQKDIQQTQSLSAFFEKQPPVVSLSLNPSVERLYRRTERVVAALFLATNHIEQSEPLRNAVRSAGTQLLEDVLSLRNEMRAAQSSNVSEFRASARYLVSLLRMLSISGFLSMQNATILVEALDELGNFLRVSQSSALSESVAFTKHDFLDASVTRITDIKDRIVIKDNVVVKDIVKMSDTGTRRTLHVRKQNIIEVLRSGGELGIAEIASSLPEYSSKMIQRDLAELISTGQVRKAGLKRWSRYSLAQ